jgi:hypothetical protein
MGERNLQLPSPHPHAFSTPNNNKQVASSSFFFSTEPIINISLESQFGNGVLRPRNLKD